MIYFLFSGYWIPNPGVNVTSEQLSMYNCKKSVSFPNYLLSVSTTRILITVPTFCQISSWWTGNSFCFINIWTIVTKVALPYSVYHLPLYEPSFRMLAWCSFKVSLFEYIRYSHTSLLCLLGTPAWEYIICLKRPNLLKLWLASWIYAHMMFLIHWTQWYHFFWQWLRYWWNEMVFQPR